MVIPPIKSKLSPAYEVPLIPFINTKYEIAVKAIPPKIEPTQVAFVLKS